MYFYLNVMQYIPHILLNVSSRVPLDFVEMGGERDRLLDSLFTLPRDGLAFQG